jgi:pSer/pThr/pTyr-binding forkhead associated (FHA) protein
MRFSQARDACHAEARWGSFCPFPDAGDVDFAGGPSPDFGSTAERADMPVITVNDQHYALRPGQNRLGGGASADVRVSDDESLGIQAIVDVRDAAHPVIRRAMPTAAVRVNGVELIDPTPLIHGDKVEIAGNELLFSDDTKTGATQILKQSEIAAMAAVRPEAPAQPITGGRLVSLVDGKEYVVRAEGITIGREAGSDIVVAQQDVSRKHAVVMRTDKGSYEIRDFSSNGVFVNQKRVRKSAVLAPSDLIRIGGEEFRFRADGSPAVEQRRKPAAPPAQTQAKASRPSTPPVVAQTAPVEPPPPRATPYVPASHARKSLATLVITNVGPTQGQRFDVRVPLAHIGRGAHNDIAINDDSVSETHAKLQRREDGWFLTDLDSTNGTYVGGSRFTGERKLEGTNELRFGGVKMQFQPAETSEGASAAGTRQIANVSRPQLNPTTNIPAVVLVPEPKEGEGGGVPAWLWAIVAMAIVAVAVFLAAVR